MVKTKIMVPGGNLIFTNPDRVHGLTIESPIHRLNPKSKIVSFIFLIVLCSTVNSFSPVLYAAYLFYLAVILLISRLPLFGMLKRSAFIVLFVILVSGLMPFIRHTEGEVPVLIVFHSIKVYSTGLLIFLNILFRAFIDVIALLILISTDTFDMILKGFAELKVPSVMVSIINITYRYIYVIRDEAIRMKRSVDARGYYGKWILSAGVFGKIIGSLFLRSYERSERVYYSMLSRGYNGAVFGRKTGGLQTSDWLFLGITLTFTSALRIFVWMFPAK